ncbi:MAG: hypothetical protein CL666_12015 [Balneola sp.]|nr:hypothetical protein [Balneola sp.]|tara:strand:- start:17741 stop:18640 length:900 start_codon:yes stop_codon:yes gene_type:complete
MKDTDSEDELISVLMLTYNQEDYIRKSIESVCNQYQYYQNIELLIIDDGSEDNTVDIIDSILVNAPIKTKFLKKKHGGVKSIAYNLNQLVDMSSGKFITFLSGDDEYIEDRFREQIDLLNTRDVKIVYGNGINMEGAKEISLSNSDKSNIVLFSNDPIKVFNHLTRELPVIFIQSILADGNFLRSFQPFDNDLIADDWVFNINVFDHLKRNKLKYRFINKPLFLRNLHKKNTSRDRKIHYQRIVQILDKYFHDFDGMKNKLEITRKFWKQSLRDLKFTDTLYWMSKYFTVKTQINKYIP